MSFRRLFLRTAACCCVALLLTSVPRTAHAQGAGVATSPVHVVTINPFFLLAGWISGEYEQRINGSIGLGGAVSYVDFSDNRYTNFEVKGRLYPNERALRGFGIALSLGLTHLSFKTDDDCVVFGTGSCNDATKSLTSPAVGVEFGYQWLLGTNQRTAIALGLGGKRFLASKSSLDGTSTVIPTYRLGIGYAF